MIHPTALIDAAAEISPDASVGAYAIIEGPVKIGARCVIEPAAHLTGDVTLGDGSTIGRAAIIGSLPQDMTFDPATPSGVTIGSETVIREHATVHRATQEGGATKIGDRNYLMAGCHVGHDATVGDDTIIANSCLLGGFVEIGSKVFLGGGSAYHQFIRVGNCAIVQGIAGLSKDVPPFCTAHGINKMGGLNAIGMRRAGLSPKERREVKNLHKLLFRSGQNLGQAVETASNETWGEHAQTLLDFVRARSKKGICQP